MKDKLLFSYLKKVIFLIVICIIYCESISFSQKSPKDTIKVLFLGNSYTYFGNLPQVVSIFARSKNIPLITRKSVKGGIYLKNHWFGEQGLSTKKIIKEGKFDYVILQDQSQAAIEVPDTLLKYAKLLCDFIRDSGSKPLFYETWAREKIPQQQETISKIYGKASMENDAMVIPVGHAWELARKLRPDAPLFLSDGSHPSPLGTYLNACVFFTFLTREEASDLPIDIYTSDQDGEILYLFSVDKEDALFAQKVTGQVMKEFDEKK